MKQNLEKPVAGVVKSAALETGVVVVVQAVAPADAFGKAHVCVQTTVPVPRMSKGRYP
jgi:ribosomal protein S1